MIMKQKDEPAHLLISYKSLKSSTHSSLPLVWRQISLLCWWAKDSIPATFGGWKDIRQMPLPTRVPECALWLFILVVAMFLQQLIRSSQTVLWILHKAITYVPFFWLIKFFMSTFHQYREWFITGVTQYFPCPINAFPSPSYAWMFPF